MSSIPLVALSPDDQVPMPQTPLDAYARAVSLEGVKQRNQALAQQISQRSQAFPVEQQQQQETLHGQQNQNAMGDIQVQEAKALQALGPQFVQRDEKGKVSGYDFDGLFNAAPAAGVSPSTVQALQSAHAEAVTKLASADTSVRNAQEAHYKKMYELFEGVKSIKDPVQRQNAWPSVLMALGRQKVDITQFPIKAPTDDELNAFEAPLGQQHQILEDAKTTSEIQKNMRDGTASQLENRYLGIQTRQRLGEKIPPEDQAFAKSYERMKTLVSTNTFQMNNSVGRYSPQDPDVIALAHGKLKIGDLLGPRASPVIRRELVQAAQQVNPNFRSFDYDVEKKVEEAYTSGAPAQQLTSIARAREHMGTFLDLAKALNNGNIQALNSVKNRFKTAFGSEAPIDFGIAKQAFSSEVGKSFAGASVALADREELQSQISNANSWKQLAGAAATADSLLEGAQKALKRGHDTGMSGTPNFGQEDAADNPLTPGTFDWSKMPKHR